MEKAKKGRTIIKWTAALLLILAAACTALLFIMQINEVRSQYNGIQLRLVEFEELIMSIDDKWMFLVVLAILFLVKAFIPILSISALCLITGAFFGGVQALGINLCGVLLLVSVRYFWGKKFGGGNAQRIISKSVQVKETFEHDGYGNPWLLFFFRLTPCFPINSVSRLYGSMGFDYRKYLLLSVGGFLPKLVFYTIIGRNLFDPLSASFLVPLIALFAFSGVILMTFHVTMEELYYGKKNKGLDNKKAKRRNKNELERTEE